MERLVRFALGLLLLSPGLIACGAECGDEDSFCDGNVAVSCGTGDAFLGQVVSFGRKDCDTLAHATGVPKACRATPGSAICVDAELTPCDDEPPEGKILAGYGCTEDGRPYSCWHTGGGEQAMRNTGRPCPDMTSCQWNEQGRTYCLDSE